MVFILQEPTSSKKMGAGEQLAIFCHRLPPLTFAKAPFLLHRVVSSCQRPLPVPQSAQIQDTWMSACSSGTNISPRCPAHYTLKDVISPQTLTIKWRCRNNHHHPAMEPTGNDQTPLPRNLWESRWRYSTCHGPPAGTPDPALWEELIVYFPRKVFHLPLSFLATTGADSLQSSLALVSAVTSSGLPRMVPVYTWDQRSNSKLPFLSQKDSG